MANPPHKTVRDPEEFCNLAKISDGGFVLMVGFDEISRSTRPPASIPMAEWRRWAAEKTKIPTAMASDDGVMTAIAVQYAGKHGIRFTFPASEPASHC